MFEEPPQNEEPTPRIRPIWLIGGSAALVVVGGCALISVIAAGLLIWFSNGVSSRSATSTPTQAVVQNPTQAVTIAAPTPLPGVSTVLPTTATLVTAAAPALPPDQAVRSYFQLVSQQRYDLTWPLLTDTFKQKFNCCAPNYDHVGYASWWDSVNYVDFGTVSIVSQNADRAVVYAELYFVMNTGARSGVDSNPYIELLYDPSSGAWRFNDKRASP